MCRGYTLIEVLAVLALVAVLAGAAVPLTAASVDRARVAGAAQYIQGRLLLARFDAVTRATFVAVRFSADGDGYVVRSYTDGNGNGVRTADIDAGIDRPLGPGMRLDGQFPGVVFGICPRMTAIDGGPLDTSDPIHVGSSRMVSFNPDGSATSGTIYIRGTRTHQYAVRVLGATARSRVFRYEFSDGAWHTP